MATPQRTKTSPRTARNDAKVDASFRVFGVARGQEIIWHRRPSKRHSTLQRLNCSTAFFGVFCLFAAILISSPLSAAQLDDSWTVTVNGQAVLVNSDGSFRLPNISAPDQFGPDGPGTIPDFVSDDFVRAIGVSTKGGMNHYVFSEFFQIRQGQSYVITNLTFTDIPPRKPESLTVIPQFTVMTAIGQTNQLRVIARYADGTTSDAAARAAWTSYRISNPNIATVDADGVVTAKMRGMVFITAVNEGASGVCQIDVAPGDPLTSVVGYVQTTNGTPIVGAAINVLELAAAAVMSATNGSFVITNVPTTFGPFRVAARLAATTAFFGTIGLLDPVPGGVTDAGILTLKQGVAWIGSVSGDWQGATNWSTGQVPGPTNDVYISAPIGVTINISQGSNVVNSIFLDSPLRLAGGTIQAVNNILDSVPRSRRGSIAWG